MRWIRNGRLGWACLVGLAGCAGPPALERAILPWHEAAYRAALEQSPGDPRQAFLAWKARERSLSLADARAADAGLSATRNPWDANRDRDAVSLGAVVFKLSCMRCHGVGANGKGADALADFPCKDFHAPAKRFAVWLHRGAPRSWFRKIREGSGPLADYPEGATTAMPAFGEALSNEQIWLAVTYLQSLDMYIKPAASVASESTREGDRAQQPMRNGRAANQETDFDG